MFGKLLSAVIETAKLPVDTVMDVFTLGGQLDDNGGSHIAKRVNKVQEKLEEMDE
jgi:hypothetical protein